MAKSFFEVHYDSADGFTVRVRPSDIHLVPEATRKHVKNAGKEFLLAMRSMVDLAIERVEQKEKPKSSRRRVNIET